MVNIKQLREAVDELGLYRNYGTVDGVREMRGENERLRRRVEELRATVETQLATINRLNRALDEERRQR